MSDQEKTTTTDGRPPDVVRAEQLRDPQQGQHKSYIVLSDEERAKGFVRPVRAAYRHVGAPRPEGLRDLSDEEQARYGSYGYVKFLPYGPERAPSTGRFYTQAMLDRVDAGCDRVTTMGRAIAETYARNPGFYGATFCTTCNVHLPVGEHGEFVWEGTAERVGT